MEPTVVSSLTAGARPANENPPEPGAAALGRFGSDRAVAANRRLAWIDYLKALGIVAVVVAHTRLPDILWPWVHSFVIPLFFLVSGYLLPARAFDAPWAQFFDRRLKRLVWAYFLFGGLAIGQAAIKSRFGAEQEPLGESLLGGLQAVLYASGSFPETHPLFLEPVALWFFPAFLSSAAVTWCVMQLAPRVAAALFGAMALGAFAGRDHAWPWEIESALAAAPLLTGGYWLRQREGLRSVQTWPLVLAPALLGGGWALALLNAPMDFRLSQFGFTPAYYLAAAMSLLGLLLIFARLPENRFVLRLSAATLFIFPTHQLLFWFFDTVARRFLELPEALLHSYAFTLPKSALALALLAGIYPAVRRRLPWL